MHTYQSNNSKRNLILIILFLATAILFIVIISLFISIITKSTTPSQNKTSEYIELSHSSPTPSIPNPEKQATRDNQSHENSQNETNQSYTESPADARIQSEPSQNIEQPSDLITPDSPADAELLPEEDNENPPEHLPAPDSPADANAPY